MDGALILFAVSLGGCLYAYAGYPALLFVLASLRPRPHRRADVLPSVTVIVPAYDEAATIERKIRNTLALDYPPGRVEILVASDGSTDGTPEAAEHAGGGRVRVLRLPRLGKMSALNRAAAEASGEVLVFTDANVLLDADALRQLVRSFADPAVGGVCGEKRLNHGAGDDATGSGEGLYGRYDRWVKRLESDVGSVYGADGVLYAVRRAAFTPIHNLSQADDLAISGRVVLAGHRLVYEPRAIAREDAPADGLAELRRKVRVVNHTIRALLELSGRADGPGFYRVQLLSHKLARYLVPLWLLAMLGSSLWLASRSTGGALLLMGQALFWALALAGLARRGRSAGRSRWLCIPYYFGLVNVAALLGLLAVVRGRRHVTWVPRCGAAPESA